MAQLMGATPFSYDNTTSRKVGFQDLPARMQNEAFSNIGDYQLHQYQDPDVLMRDRTFSFDQNTSMNMADEEWESCSPKPSLQAEEGPDTPKPKKTRRRKPKAPLDQETAQKKRREALDKNKQAAAKCRARKKLDENKRQYELQRMRSENQMLLGVLSRMEEEVKVLKCQVEQHIGCEDDTIRKAKKFIEAIESNYQRLNDERRNLNANQGFAQARFEEEMMIGFGERNGSGDFDISHNNAESDGVGSQQECRDVSHNHGLKYPTAGDEMHHDSNQGTHQPQYSSPPFASNVSNDVSFGTNSTGPTLNPLWVSTKNLSKSSEDSMFDEAIASAGSFDSMLSSPKGIAGNMSTTFYPDIPSPTAGGFDMPLFDPSDPMLPTSTVLDPNFDASAPLFNDFDFELTQSNGSDATETELLSQLDSTYASQSSHSPRSSKSSKGSSPEWEALQLKRPDLDPSLRRDSALGPEVNEEQLLKDLSIKNFPMFRMDTESGPSRLRERRKRSCAAK